MVKAFSKVSLFMPLQQTRLDFKRHSESASIKMSLPHVFVVVSLPPISSIFNPLLLCRVVFLSSAFLVVLLITQRFVCSVAFAMFFLPLVNAPN
jgi:hypothetical protein